MSPVHIGGGTERKRCHGDGCRMTATHGPSGEAVACWSHAGDFPCVAPLPELHCVACNYSFDANSMCKCGRRKVASKLCETCGGSGRWTARGRLPMDPTDPEGAGTIMSEDYPCPACSQ